MKLKVLTLVGTRPEIIKLSRVIPELDKHTEHTLVHTGQNYAYELNEIFFKEMGIRKPDHFLEAVGETTAETIGNVIANTDAILDKIKPDAFLIYGDTNSCLGVISAKRRKIPIFHLEAGNRCFDQRVPEEINRKIVDHLSDINMVHSEHARRYLLNEGLSPDKVFKSGSPMPEVFEEYEKQISDSKALENLKLKKRDYFVLSTHREENVDNPENFQNLLDSLEAICNKYQKRIIFSAHPRTMKKMEESGVIKKFNNLIEVMKPLGFFDYNSLQKNAFCVLSDSGTLTEESSILGFPGIMIRQAHERPEGVDRASVLMSDLNKNSLINSIELATSQDFKSKRIEDYDSSDFSKKVVRIILSYTDFVNKTVWKK